jgi:serine/threonine protein phosphatase PrpC
LDIEHEHASRRNRVAAPVKGDDFTPAAALVRAEFGARSHRGRVQEENDDHHLVLGLRRRADMLLTSLATVDLPTGVDENAYAAVVADGIGAAGAGSVAARLAISTLAHLAFEFGQWNMRLDPATASEVLERATWLYRRTHETVLQRSLADAGFAGMAATLTGLYTVGTVLFVAHIGHSRCFLFRNGMLVQLTRDDTLEEHRATSPHPIRIGRTVEDVSHVVTRAVGGDDGGRVVVEHFRLADDDTLLLCTNGLTDVVEDDVIADALASRRTPGEQCDQCVDLALAKGTTDNVTVVIGNYRIPPSPDDAA